MEEPLLSACELVGLLAEEHRLAVVAALALGATSVTEVRTATGLDARRARTALDRLERAGLVVRADDDTLVLLSTAFGLAARAEVGTGASEEHADQPDDRARILRSFVRAGRLSRLPTTHSKRLVVLDLIVQDFDLGVRYTEKQVNATLVRWHPDTASLRRWLVDVGFLDRKAGWYWRCGGTAV
ncbi:MAG: DUF2087 domain-containing protein [Acidimicrobiales bacterium]